MGSGDWHAVHACQIVGGLALSNLNDGFSLQRCVDVNVLCTGSSKVCHKCQAWTLLLTACTSPSVSRVIIPANHEGCPNTEGHLAVMDSIYPWQVGCLVLPQDRNLSFWA